MTRIRRWFQTWWYVIPEPKEMSLAWGGVYTTLLFTGVATILAPPRTVAVALGYEATMLFAAMLTMGVVLAMVGGWSEYWTVERLGLILMVGGLSLYGAVVLSMHFVSDGSRLTQFGVILALIGTLVIRYLMIWRFTFRPRADSDLGG